MPYYEIANSSRVVHSHRRLRAIVCPTRRKTIQASFSLKTAIEAGVRCIEHGQMIDLETAELMAEKTSGGPSSC